MAGAVQEGFAGRWRRRGTLTSLRDQAGFRKFWPAAGGMGACGRCMHAGWPLATRSLAREGGSTQRFSIGRRGTSVGDDIVERQQY